MTDNVKLYLKTKNGEEGFRKVTNESIFSKPTLLCCGGQDCCHGNEDKANGFIKKAEALLNTARVSWELKPFQLASVTYSPAIAGIDAVHEWNSGRSKPSFDSFVDTQLKPLFLDDSHQKLPIEQVMSNFRNIQILAHSYGAVFVQQVGNTLVDEMKASGFTDDEINMATQQVLVVTAGSAANIGKGKAKFTQINVLHGKDEAVKQCSYNCSLGQSLIDKSIGLIAKPLRYLNPLQGCEVDPNSREVLVFAPASDTQEATAMRLADSKHDEPLEITDTKFHEPDTYFDYSMTGAGMILRTAIAVALNNGVNHSLGNSLGNHVESPSIYLPLPTPRNLLKSPCFGYSPSSTIPIAELRIERDQEFSFDRKRDFTHVAHAIGYEERMGNAFGETAVRAP